MTQRSVPTLSATRIVLAVLLVSLLILGLCFNPVQESDVFMYLAIAREFLTTGSWPKLDPFSFGIPFSPWATLHEWGAYFFFYFFHSLSADWGLLLAKSCLVVTVYSLIFLEMFRIKIYSNWILLITVLAVYAGSTRFAERSSLFGDLFANLVLLFLFHRTDRRVWKVLPVIFLFWTNLHPSFPIGLFLVGVSLFCDFTQGKLKEPQLRVLSLMACISACFCHPEGWKGFLYPFSFFFNEASYLQGTNFEWVSPWEPRLQAYWEFNCFYLETAAVGFLFLLVFFKTARKHLNERPLFELLVFGMATYLGLRAVRFTLLASVMEALVGTRLVFSLRQNREVSPQIEAAEKNRAIRIAENGVALATLIAALNSVFQLSEGTYQSGFDRRQLGIGLDPRYFPNTSLQFIESQGIQGNIFNTYWLGCYLAWKWGRKRKVFAHGFMTNTDFIENNYLEIARSSEAFEKIVKKYKIEAFLVGKQMSLTGLLALLRHNKEWRLAYEDPASYVFLYSQSHSGNI